MVLPVQAELVLDDGNPLILIVFQQILRDREVLVRADTRLSRILQRPEHPVVEHLIRHLLHMHRRVPEEPVHKVPVFIFLQPVRIKRIPDTPAPGIDEECPDRPLPTLVLPHNHGMPLTALLDGIQIQITHLHGDTPSPFPDEPLRRELLRLIILL
ncbi:MAG: hypothetical protein IJ795_06365 [Bacteroidales bacterium]|nr:hypothetical protein [Bacteroidales bacterium]